MALTDIRELDNTKRKLAQLELHYARSKARPNTNPELRALSLRSMRRLINQMKEEIALFECGKAH